MLGGRKGFYSLLTANSQTQNTFAGSHCLKHNSFWFVVIQLLCHILLFASPWTDCSTPGFPILHHLLELAQAHVHPAISSSFIPFSSCLQSFPASGSLLMSHFFASGDQSTRVSASTSVVPMNIQG